MSVDKIITLQNSFNKKNIYNIWRITTIRIRMGGLRVSRSFALILILVLLSHYAYASTRSNANVMQPRTKERAEIKANYTCKTGSYCTPNCSGSDLACKNTAFTVEENAVLELNCIGVAVCENSLVTTMGRGTYIRVNCNGDFACSGSKFLVAGGADFVAGGLNVVYLTEIEVRNRQAQVSIVFNDCYGVKLNNSIGSPAAQVYCNTFPDDGMFGKSGWWCCRGKTCASGCGSGLPLC